MLQLFFFLVFFIAAFVALISHLFLWYETDNDPEQLLYMRKHAGCSLLARFSKGVLHAFIVQVAIALLYPFGLVSTRDGNKDDNGPVLILLHGLYHNASAWFLFRYWLGMKGYTTVVPVNYNSLTADFHSSAGVIRKKVHRILEEHKGRKAAFIGHSLGGLHIHTLLADEHIQKRTVAAVTMGTPYGGSRLAAFCLGLTGRQLRPCSALVTNLFKNRDAFVPTLVLHSPFDNMVVPHKSLIPPTGRNWTTQMTAPTGHIRMLFHEPNAQKAAEFIRSAMKETQTTSAT